MNKTTNCRSWRCDQGKFQMFYSAQSYCPTADWWSIQTHVCIQHLWCCRCCLSDTRSASGQRCFQQKRTQKQINGGKEDPIHIFCLQPRALIRNAAASKIAVKVKGIHNRNLPQIFSLHFQFPFISHNSIHFIYLVHGNAIRVSDALSFLRFVCIWFSSVLAHSLPCILYSRKITKGVDSSRKMVWSCITPQFSYDHSRFTGVMHWSAICIHQRRNELQPFRWFLLHGVYGENAASRLEFIILKDSF